MLPHGAGGRSSGVEHDLAKVGVEGSNPFARSSLPPDKLSLIGWHRAKAQVWESRHYFGRAALRGGFEGADGLLWLSRTPEWIIYNLTSLSRS